MYKLIHKLEQLQSYIADSKIVAFDFETAPDELYLTETKASLDPHKSHIVGISFSVAEGDGVYLPLAHRVDENASDPKEIWDYLAEFFTNPEVTKIAHNLAFESAFLYAKNIVIQEPCYDTIAASQLMYKNEKEFRTLSESGLKTLVPEFYKERLPSFADTVGNAHFDELDPAVEKTINYACADADYALRLYHTFNNYFDRFLPNHRFIVEKVESPTAVYVGIMRYNGLPVDRQLMVDKRTEVERAVVQTKGKIEYIIGGNIAIGANASTAAFKKYLFDDLQLPKMKITEKEKDALDDETLILLKEWCQINKPDLIELFSLVQEYRHLTKIKSTYIDGYIKYISNATRRLHPDLLPLTTETGRFASKNPNCQNMPRSGNDDVGVRNFITAPEGKLLLSLDFSQIELRVGAFYCKDEQMLETYKTGGDIHALTTAVIYKISLEEAMDESHPLYKERRSIAKNCNFGVFFGLFPRGLQKTLRFKAGLKVELDECEKIINNIKMGYPRLSRWQEEVKKRAGFRAYTETWLGRRRAIRSLCKSCHIKTRHEE